MPNGGAGGSCLITKAFVPDVTVPVSTRPGAHSSNNLPQPSATWTLRSIAFWKEIALGKALKFSNVVSSSPKSTPLPAPPKVFAVLLKDVVWYGMPSEVYLKFLFVFAMRFIFLTVILKYF